MVSYKQLCINCKKNYITISRAQKYAVCYDCQKNELNKKIDDKNFRKMFDISEDLYKENSFLRSIKLNYIRYGKLSEKQIDAFRKTVENNKKTKKI